MGNPGLVEQTPGLARNRLVLAVLLQLAGATGKARAQLADLGKLLHRSANPDRRQGCPEASKQRMVFALPMRSKE